MNPLTKIPNKQELQEEVFGNTTYHDEYLASLDPEKVQRIKRTVAHRRHGLHGVAPTMCLGPEKCLFIEHCPIPPRDKFGRLIKVDEFIDYGPESDYPIHRPCVLESLYMQQKVYDYFDYLQVEPGNPIEISLVNELATIDLLKNRALMILAKGDAKDDGRDFLKVDISPGEFGDATKTSLHPAVTVLDQLEKRREKLLDKLAETRKAKIEFAQKQGNVETNSALLTQIENLAQALKVSSKQVITDVVEIELDD